MNKKGSILLWTMFVSLFIVSFFVAYQSGILTAIKSSASKWDKFASYNSLDSYFNSLKNNPHEIWEIWDYRINSLDYTEYLSFSGYLINNETTEYWITWTWWTTTTLNWNLVEWWPIEYNVISFNTWSENIAAIYSSGYTTEWNSFTITLDTSKNFNIIAVHNLWWLASYNISKWNTNILPPSNKYAIYRKYNYMYSFIWNREVINFVRWTSGIDYDSFDIFLNSSNY